LLPSLILSVRDRVAARRAAEPVGSRLVAIRCTTTVLRIMLPGATAAARRQLGGAVPAPTDPACTADPTNSAGATNPTGAADATRSSNSTNPTGPAGAAYTTDAASPSYSTNTASSTNSTCSPDPANATRATDVSAIPTARDWIRGTVAAVDVIAVAAIDIRIPVEVVVVVNVDVVVATPSTAPSPTTAPKRTHHDAYTKRDRHSGGVISRWWIVDRWVRIDRRTVHYDRIIGRHIHDLGIRLLDDDHTLAFDSLRFHFLLFVGLQIAFFLRLLAHALNGIHYVLLLSQECVT
jgi:hypothetical protein